MNLRDSFSERFRAFIDENNDLPSRAETVESTNDRDEPYYGGPGRITTIPPRHSDIERGSESTSDISRVRIGTLSADVIRTTPSTYYHTDYRTDSPNNLYYTGDTGSVGTFSATPVSTSGLDVNRELKCDNCGEEEAMPYAMIFEDRHRVKDLCEECWVIKYDKGRY